MRPSFRPSQASSLSAPNTKTGRPFGLGALLTGCVVALGLTTTGCADDDPGQVDVEYVLGNGKSCEDLNILSVEGVLVANAMGEEEVIGDEYPADTAACQTPGILTFNQVPVGNYDIKVFARDAMGVVVMDNGGKQTPDLTELVGDGTTVQVANIRLADSPARVLVRWRIADGFVSCEEAGIASFRVDVWDEAGTELLHTNDLPCNGGQKNPQGYLTLDDPNGRINGKLFGEASVVPLDAAGQQLASPARFDLPAPVGPGYAALFTIDCPSGPSSCVADGWEKGS